MLTVIWPSSTTSGLSLEAETEGMAAIFAETLLAALFVLCEALSVVDGLSKLDRAA